MSGQGLTIWRGNALGCEIELRHSEYMNGGARGSCNDGMFVARSVGVSGNSYTSTLNITVQQEMINRSVECIHLNLGGQVIEIGDRDVNITQGR